MKHRIIKKQSIGGNRFLVEVQLLPDNEMETTAIRNCEIMDASFDEKEMVENYLNFNLGLGNYSIFSPAVQNKTSFSMEVFVD